MTAVEEPVRIRTDEYDRMTEVGLFEGRRIELVEGTLYEMPPMRTPHVIVLVRLQSMLAALNSQKRLLVQIPVRVPDFDEPEPDLAVLREPLSLHKPIAAECLLAIEVSNTTLRFDRERKLPAYLRGGVDAVWIVNIPERQVEVSSKLGERVFRPSEQVSPTIEGIVVDLSALFADVSAEIDDDSS
jgi:Uma2 family endonuclease